MDFHRPAVRNFGLENMDGGIDGVRHGRAVGVVRDRAVKCRHDGEAASRSGDADCRNAGQKFCQLTLYFELWLVFF